MSKTKTHQPTAQEIAKDAADRYFADLASAIPYGEVNLVDAVTKVQDALLSRYPDDVAFANEDAALRAGYILGVEIGRRIGGAR